jgi:hypothetical protein
MGACSINDKVVLVDEHTVRRMSMNWKKYNLMLVLAAVVPLAILSLPVHAQKDKKKKELPAPTNVKLNVDVPSLAVLEGTEQSQTKGDLRITVSQETFRAEESFRTEQKQVPPPSFLGIVTMMPCANGVYVERTQIPGLKVTPERLVFHVHINNQMPRVFRGSGLVVQFNVAGKVVNVDPSGYGDLVNVIIPPRSEQDITIIGPEVSNVPSPSTVGLFFYDVVTKIDQAGNVIEKQNYEWYFSYRTQTTVKDFTVPAPVRTWACP